MVLLHASPQQVTIMKLFLLKPIDPKKHPFDHYDVAMGFVVRAESAYAARSLVTSDKSYDQGWGDEGAEVWMDEKETSCTPILFEGEPEIILRDFNAG